MTRGAVSGRWFLSVLACAVALALGTIAPNAAAAGRVPKGDAFYVPPQPLVKEKPGTLIRSTSIDAPPGARAWKILYHSRTVDGHDVAVSGVVVAPAGPAPKRGRVVVAWAHGTTGLADVCAPSKRPDVASTIPLVQTFLDAGYVVAATDYQGLGTPGLHPWIVGESEGRNVLDAARAARNVKATAAGTKLLLFGHSQGGGAALFAGELATSYAPEFSVLGVAAAAPAADVEQLLPLAGAVSGGAGYVLMGIEGFHVAYPEFDPAAVLTPEALARASVVDEGCQRDVVAALSGLPTILAHNPLDVPAIRTILHTNSAGNRPAGGPVLIVQGSADGTVPQIVTDAFAKKACAAGDTVDYRVYTDATHSSVIMTAGDDIAAWLANRVNGAASPTTCG